MGWGWCAWGGWWCSWSRGLPDVVTWLTVVGGAAPPEAGPDFRTEKHAVTLAGRTKDFENQANQEHRNRKAWSPNPQNKSIWGK